MNGRLSKAQRRAIERGKLVETLNALDIVAFAARYFDTTTISEAEKNLNTKTGKDLEIFLLSANALRADHRDVLEACFTLIEKSSADDYKASEIKWSPTSKRKEMVLPDMRYLVVREREDSHNSESLNTLPAADSRTYGFVSFMITYEDRHEVIYVYEIHLDVGLRSQGVGAMLMQMVESVGRKAGLEKCMLTVFKTNQKALRWYEHCGYGLDDFSPGPRLLRNGTIKEPTYLILSKSLKRPSDPKSSEAPLNDD